MKIQVHIPDDIGAILENNPNISRAKLLEKTGLQSEVCKFYCRVWKNKDGKIKDQDNDYQQDTVKYNFGSDDATVELRTQKVITTLEELIEVTNIDLEKWTIERWVANSWNVTMKIDDQPITRTNYQVKAWLKTKIPNAFEIALRSLVENLPTFKPVVHKKTKYKKSDYAAEVAPFDAHYGKFAWHLETGQGNMDIKECDKVFDDAIDRNLSHLCHYPISKIYYILGNDLMHVENLWAQTPKGNHRLDTDDRLPKVIEHCENATIKAIMKCREVAPVKVIWIPGNHDPHSSYWLSRVLDAYFRDDKYIEIDNGPAPQKAELWGNLLVGWTHDASGRRAAPTVNLLAQYWPKEWGQSRYREWHTGHKHKKNATKFMPVDTVGGVIVRQIPAISTVDYWHTENVFTDAVPACESFLWHKEHGVEGQYTANVKYPTK